METISLEKFSSKYCEHNYFYTPYYTEHLKTPSDRSKNIRDKWHTWVEIEDRTTEQLDDTIKIKINKLFQNDDFKVQKKKINFIYFQNKLDDFMYKYNDDLKPPKDKKHNSADLLHYCFENHKENMPHEYKDSKSLLIDFQIVKKLRSISGICLTNNEGDLLCIINDNNQMNLPKGKEDFKDGNDRLVTAIRELSEEAGITLSEEQKENIVDCIDVLNFKKSVRLFFVDDYPKEKVTLDYRQPGETLGLVWLPIPAIINILKSNKMKFESESGDSWEFASLLSSALPKYALAKGIIVV